MTSQREQIEAMYQAMKRVQARPDAYVSDGVPSVVNFKNGLFLVMRASDLNPDLSDIREEIARTRGWNPSRSFPPERDMFNEGLSDERISEESLSIEIEALRHWLNSEAKMANTHTTEMLDHREQIEDIYKELQIVQARVGLYISHDLPSCVTFFIGSYVAERALGIDIDLSATRKSIAHEKGWRTSQSYGPHRDMVEKGLTDEEITVELLSIETEAIRQWLDNESKSQSDEA